MTKPKASLQIANIRAVASILRSRYRDFAHHNKRNPLDELLFIICSVKTQESNYRATYSALKGAFPTFGIIAEAPAEYLALSIKRGGLSAHKSKAMKNILDRLRDEFGRATLAPLRKMDDATCEAFLMSLPGVGLKVARCVMMYSLDRLTFPVDTHCWRICHRLGWVKHRSRDHRPSPREMDCLQAKIPPELRFSLHVNMVSLGREFCTARNPRCQECPIGRFCRRVGVKRAT